MSNKDSLWKPADPKTRRRAGERMFAWLEATELEGAAQARAELDDLWQLVPQPLEDEFLARLRSKTVADFFSAYSELWHLRALNTPPLQAGLAERTGSGSLPDLVLRGPDGGQFLIECHVRLLPDQQALMERLENEFFELVWRKLRRRDIRLRVSSVTSTTTSPSASRFARFLDDLAKAEVHSKSMGPYRDLGEYEYEDGDAGWTVRFHLLLRSGEETSHSQLVIGRTYSAYWCQGESLLTEALDRKKKQHSGSELPVLVALAWNYFEHQPELEDVLDTVASERDSLAAAGVDGVLWSGPCYPWGAKPAGPRLVTWTSSRAFALFDVWPFTKDLVGLT